MQLAMLLRHGIDLAWHKRVPGQLVLQMTDKCNARCPQCQMRVTERFERSTLSVDAMKAIIDSAAAKGIRVLSFTGGEPMLMLDELTELIQHAGRAGIPFIRTGTNGYLFKSPQAAGWEDRVKRTAERLAATPLRNFWISIDSAVPAVHERMRGFPGLILGIEKALPIFHSFGLFPSANLGLNRNVGGDATWNVFEDQFDEEDTYLEAFYYAVRRALQDFYRQVHGMGFTMVNTCYPMSIEGAEQLRGLNAVYGATSSDRVIRFSDGERAMLFKALFETVPEYRSQLRVFSPLTSLYSLFHRYAGHARKEYGCRGGRDFFFVNSVDGNTYPCGYRGGDNLGRFEDLDLTRTNRGRHCTDCDWECFRDPSELAGPVLEAFSAPSDLLRRTFQEPYYLRLWLEDLRYYRACSYFNGRVGNERARLERFSQRPANIGLEHLPAAAVIR